MSLKAYKSEPSNASGEVRESMQKTMDEIASQEDAHLVAAMARRAAEDAHWAWVMECAGCTDAEIRAAMKGDPN
jgi:hypothetical protein